jgi:hypothetical protein
MFEQLILYWAVVATALLVPLFVSFVRNLWAFNKLRNLKDMMVVGTYAGQKVIIEISPGRMAPEFWWARNEVGGRRLEHVARNPAVAIASVIDSLNHELKEKVRQEVMAKLANKRVETSGPGTWKQEDQ